MDWLNLLLSFACGTGLTTLTTLITLPSLLKKAKAEARATELENLQKVADGWRLLCDERQEACTEKDNIIAEKDAKIDALYAQISAKRDENDTLNQENTRLKVKAAADEVRLCIVRGCEKRQPQSGY